MLKKGFLLLATALFCAAVCATAKAAAQEIAQDNEETQLSVDVKKEAAQEEELSSIAASAQRQRVQAEPEAGVTHEVAIYNRYMPSCTVDAQPGKVGIIDSEAEYGFEFKAIKKLPVKLSVNQHVININNSTVVELPAKLIALGLDVETTLPFFNIKDTYFRLGFTPSTYSDGWNFNSSAFRIPSRYFLINRPNDKWTFVGGVAVYPDSIDFPVLPILGFIYKPNDNLTFNFVADRPNITYQVNDKLALFVEGGAALDTEFEVTKDDRKGVILQYNEAHAGGGLTYSINKYIGASVTCGGVFGRSLQYDDSLGKVNIDNGFYSEFRLSVEI